MISRVSHISIAVPSLDEAVRFYRDVLGLEATRTLTVEERGVRLAFIPVGDVTIQLIEPLRPDSAVGRFVARRGPGLYHLGFAVEDVAAAARQVAERGASLLDPQPRPSPVGQVVFIAPSGASGALIELNQPFPEPAAGAEQPAAAPAGSADLDHARDIWPVKPDAGSALAEAG